ncbi:MAG: hypothetical protein HC837_14540, partial [Chloroflexaceae bacterium]|nr:hypothetical protein [Chloroflexaceae bacterium]
SSELPTDAAASYTANQVIDGSLETSWVEGVDGPGVGESFTLTFPAPLLVEQIGMSIGFDRDDAIFTANNRIKQATIRFSNGYEFEQTFADTRGIQTFDIAPPSPELAEVTSVTVVIQDIYPGTRFDDTCLAEIEVWGRTP